MILVDTSVWVDHLRGGDNRLVSLLDECRVLTHPFIVGELACGNLRNRTELLALLAALPPAPDVTNDEALFFIEEHELMGLGVGYIDVHLLASAKLAESAQLWTRDKRLRAAADALALSYSAGA